MNVGLDEVIHGTTIYARGLLRCAMNYICTRAFEVRHEKKLGSKREVKISLLCISKDIDSMHLNFFRPFLDILLHRPC
jgi:hypothetical protein